MNWSWSLLNTKYKIAFSWPELCKNILMPVNSWMIGVEMKIGGSICGSSYRHLQAHNELPNQTSHLTMAQLFFVVAFYIQYYMVDHVDVDIVWIN